VAWAIGVDVGGTFTDFYALDEERGEVRLWKRPSTPHNPGAAILEGLKELSAACAIPLDQVARFSHGTTVATNTLIQRKGKPVALVTTKGFRDLIEIGRQIRPHLYSLQHDQPEPLVPRERRFEVGERIDAEGHVHRPVSEADVEAVIAALRANPAPSVAVCFLFAYLNPAHEKAVGARIAASLPDVHLSLSSEVQPEFREYERFTTTVINAYLRPVLSDYIATLERGLGALLPRASIGINQSSGGLMTLRRAYEFPVRTALSGPAAGAIGAQHAAALAGRPNVITIDVGGTSADVALIRNGKLDVAYGREVEGFPIRLPMVDINSIGAGGGSIAWFDRDGLLKMGPMSAGAVPGPACYGKGGAEATLSDANLVLGRLSPALLAGSMALDAGLACRAIEPFARKMGKSVEETALGMIDISVANMVRAIRTLSVERGHDPRKFALMPFGGAGPLHARDIAAALGIKEIVVPPAPGILCAEGLVVSDIKENFVASNRIGLDAAGIAELRRLLADILARVEAWRAAENLPAGALALECSVDMRYVGQNYELSVALDAPALPEASELAARFFAAHERSYGFHNPAAPIEAVNLRLVARATLRRKPAPGARTGAPAAPMPRGTRPVHFAAGGPVAAAVYRRDDLAPGAALAGPAIIEQLDATTPLYPGDLARVDGAGALIIEVKHG
jgi:N-methylhydantoinase A